MNSPTLFALLALFLLANCLVSAELRQQNQSVGPALETSPLIRAKRYGYYGGYGGCCCCGYGYGGGYGPFGVGLFGLTNGLLFGGYGK